jgi:hypothetical protein
MCRQAQYVGRKYIISKLLPHCRIAACTQCLTHNPTVQDASPVIARNAAIQIKNTKREERDAAKTQTND